MSLSVQNVSFVCRCCRRHKLLTFSPSSPGPLGKFQPDLAQKHPCGKTVYVCSKKGLVFRHLGPKECKKVERFNNLLLYNHIPNFNQTWYMYKASLGVRFLSLCK